MSNKNTYLDLADDNDFGFTFAHEEELLESNPSHSSLQEEVNDLKKRLAALNKIFMPLLENLSKDPDKPMIKWPNRKDILLKTLTKV